jgi:UrcA family protein
MHRHHECSVRSLILGVSIAAAAVTVGSAKAAPQSAPPVQIVSDTVTYSDLDLNTAAGAQRMAFRLRVAANRVCGGDDPLVHSGNQLVPCRKAAIARAIAGLDAPLVKEALGIATGRSEVAQQ